MVHSLIRDAWVELWQRNRGGGLLTLAFWYTLIVTLYQYLVASRLGPSLPKSLTALTTHPTATAVLPHLSSGLWLKLILVYLTFLVIILPFTLGGLYGGIATAIRERPEFTGFLSFFRFAYNNFWRALSQILLAVLYAIVVFAVVVGLAVGIALIAGNSPISAIAPVVLVIAALLWLIGTMLYWFGMTFSSDIAPARGWFLALRWGAGHLGALTSSSISLVLVLLVALTVMSLLVKALALIGTVLFVLVMGMVAPAFVAVFAVLLYFKFPHQA